MARFKQVGWVLVLLTISRAAFAQTEQRSLRSLMAGELPSAIPNALTVRAPLSGLITDGFVSGLPNATTPTEATLILSSLNRFTYRIGGTAPPPQVLSITSEKQNHSVSVTSDPSQRWLAVTPGSVVVPGRVTVSATPTGLSAGTYTGRITVGGNAEYGTTNLNVFLDVLPATPNLDVPQSTVAFDYVTGGQVPAERNVRVNSSSGPISFTTTASGGGWLSIRPTNGVTPQDVQIRVNPQGLEPRTYTGQVTIFSTEAGNSPISFQVVLVVSSGNTLSIDRDGVTNGASFLRPISPGSWITIKGRGLATTPAPGRIWTREEIVNGQLPSSLDGASVRINNKPAAVYFVSPTQLNVQAPDDVAEGDVVVEVVNQNGTARGIAVLQQIAPGLFARAGPNQRILAAAVHADGVYVGTIAEPGTRAVKPADRILLFGTGFGPTNPARRAGFTVDVAPLVAPAQVRIGGIPAAVEFSGLVAPGLYQFNVVVPDVPNGEQPVVIETSGRQTQPDLYLPVQR